MAPGVDRSEQMRERLAKKVASKTCPSDVVITSLPGLKTAFLLGRTLPCFLWLTTAALAGLALFSGADLPLVLFSIMHLAYFANFSRTDMSSQLSFLSLVLVLIGWLTTPKVRLVLFAMLIMNILTDIVVGYNIFERMLYCHPSNQLENEGPIAVGDFLQRVFEAPSAPSYRPDSKPFAMQAPKAGTASDGFEYATSRAERRKK